MAELNSTTLIKQLQQPDFFPHPVKTPIKVIQTHASAVFLTGDYAYKLKKPVNFGFLDYSTLEKRQHFLTQELEMNREISPDIYLEVLAITRFNNQLILAGEGQPVDYVLKMRQFPQDCLLINLFQQGNLKEEHLIELAKVVAKFHQKAKINDYISSFGEVEKIRESIDENYALTNKYIGLVQTQEKYEETQEFTDAFLLEKKELLKQRQEGGKIRECHGDLHLKNICLWQNRIQLFDRIEFNEAFRFVDVMYDVAFTMMDLDARGRTDLSNIFLNTYLEQTGDWEGVQVLPLYLSRQAYVRAKVTSMLLDDPAISAPEKQEATQAATNYYRLAWEYTKPRQGGMILMSGLSGSGKTTVAQYLARRINAISIRSDAVRKHLAGIPLTQLGSNELYQPEMSEKTYHYLLELGVMLAEQGFPVVLDAKFDRHYWREKAITLAQDHQIPLSILYCDAPIKVLCDRLEQRQGDISDATPNLVQHQQTTYESFTEIEQAYVTILDTTIDWHNQLNSWLNLTPYTLTPPYP